MPKEYLISEAFNNVFCTLAPSPIHGVGVFALKDIPKNIIVFSSISWETLDASILKKIDENILIEYTKKFKTSYEGLKIPSKGYN